MASSLVKISLYAASFAVIGALGHQPLGAFSNTSLPNNAPQGTDTWNSAENDLLLLAARNIELMNSKLEVIEKKEKIDSNHHYYIPSFIPERPSTVSAASSLAGFYPYSNKWAKLSSTSPRRRKVPEPSALLGLMAIAGWLAIQHNMKKLSTKSHF